jgi:hypothetical protein
MWDLNDIPEDELVQAQADDDILARQRVERERKEREAREATPSLSVGQEAARDHMRRWAEDPVNGGIGQPRQQGEVRWARLRDDSWGVRGLAEDVYEGNEVTVTKASGTTSRVRVRRVFWIGLDNRTGRQMALAAVNRL